MSTINRMEGRGGYMYVPRAMYSLRMSFWIVPRIFSPGTPRSSAASCASRRSAWMSVVGVLVAVFKLTVELAEVEFLERQHDRELFSCGPKFDPPSYLFRARPPYGYSSEQREIPLPMMHQTVQHKIR